MHVPVTSPETLSEIAQLSKDHNIERIHFLAWRDLDDAEAGGSELHAHSIAAIWAEAGIDVTMRTSAAKGLPARARRAGYDVSRYGSRYSVFARSPLAQLAGKLGPADVVIEIWNGMPFFSPIWARGRRAIWLHHVHGPMWNQTLPAPLARVGVTLEEKIAPKIYRNERIVTLSDSSERELLEDLKFRPENVTVIPPGINDFFQPGGARSETPLLTAVGRLVPVKDFPRLIKLIARAREQVPNLELRIVGEGYERPNLEALIESLGATSYIHLVGRISDEDLRSLYQQSWLVVSTSTREGWGMTITEAAACGTPAVVTDISGHSDAVVDGQSGFLAATDNELLAHIVRLCTNNADLAELQTGALQRAKELTWESAALQHFRVLTTLSR